MSTVERIRIPTAGRRLPIFVSPSSRLTLLTDHPSPVGAGLSTGARCDVKAVTVLLHTYGALAVWDFAAAAPHVEIST
jgi:selenocysteine lyase/cysteine desulfurase